MDMTMGSGTTMAACALLGRKGIGIERERKFYDIAVKRVGDAIAAQKNNLFNE